MLKIKQKLSKTLTEAERFLFENYSLSSSALASINKRRYSKKCILNKCVCFNEVIRSVTIKMKLKMKISHRSHRRNINKPNPRHGHKYTKYKICLSIMMVICIKQHLSNIWSSINEKVKQHWCWVEKGLSYKESVYSKDRVSRLWCFMY